MRLLGIMLLQLLSTPLLLLAPLPLKIAVDSVVGGRPLPRLLAAILPAFIANHESAALIAAVLLMLLAGFIVHLQGMCSWYLQTYTGERLVLDFRSVLFRHAQRLPLTYYDSRASTETIYRIQQDASAIQLIAIQGVVPFIAAAVSFAGILIVMARLDVWLSLVALGISPMLYLLAKACTQEVRERWSRVKELDSSAMSVMQEVISSLRIVKAFGQECREEQRFFAESTRRMQGQVQLGFIQGGFHLLVGLTIAAGTAIALFIGVGHVRAGILTVGELLMVMAYMGQIYEPLKTLSTKLPDVQSWLASVDRAFALLDVEPESAGGPSAKPLVRARGRIEFEDVYFSYTGYSNVVPVLNGVAFTVEPQTRVGIVGSTGTGKTTLVNLLMRFYEPCGGRITLDGTNIRNFKLADLRKQFSLVLQEPVLLRGTVAENIAYAMPRANRKQIIAAAELANAHEFISALPDGYNTHVGERGGLLSGGQRQRIALARAFLLDAPILILDEPTSAVDVRTESLIMAAVDRLMRGRTTFIIAHRLSTLKGCDVILALENGKVVASTQANPEIFEELTRTSGTYSGRSPVHRLEPLGVEQIGMTVGAD